MKYNKTKTPKSAPAVVNHQGGSGFEFAPEYALLSLLANGIKNTYYEKEGEQEKRLTDLISKIAAKDPLLVAKMLVYTRSVTGQRSVTHRGAVALLPYLSGKTWAKDFFSKRSRSENYGGVVYRLDDMLEIAACYFALNPGKSLPNALKRGFAAALAQSDAYELAKYKGEGKAVKLVDLINLVRPKSSNQNGIVEVDAKAYDATVKNSKKGYQNAPVRPLENGKVAIPALRALVLGLLNQFNTIEDKTSKLGAEVAKQVKSGEITKDQAAEKLKAGKEEILKTSFEQGEAGYRAVIGNLRNLIKNASSKASIDAAVAQITNEVAIKKSLIAPHQIDIALEVVLADIGAGYMSTPILNALNKAYELSIPNMSDLGAFGNTAVVLDVSGSMIKPIQIGVGRYGSQGAIQKGALIAATLAKGLSADVYVFDYDCRKAKYNPLDSVNTIKNSLSRANGESTNFHSIFPALNKRYDRVFIISDMQGQDAIGYTLSDYKKAFNVDPHVYCVNLCGYANTMFKPASRVYQIFGYHADIYELIKKVEIDPKALLEEIKRINISQKVKKSSKKILTVEKV